ncbi:MAG TPA: ABC transporter [Planctomycetes bacterium]|nr:ABC transporter [Planctomycetota bacterium]
MTNPIIERELVGALRTRKAAAFLVGVAVLFTVIVALRWPTDARVALSGSGSQQMCRLFAYGLLAALLLLVPGFPATSIVREKKQGTLELLLNSSIKPWGIYLGKLVGVMGLVVLLVATSLPAAAACYAMGGVGLGQLATLYLVLLVMALEYTALGLLVSSYCNSTDSALRVTYGLVLLAALVTVGPHLFLEGKGGPYAQLAARLRYISPIPAVMELVGQSDWSGRGVISARGAPGRFLLVAVISTLAMMGATIARLNHRIFDRARPQGRITDERSLVVRLFRRLVFLVDPQRRKRGIAPLVNPVMVKEFRSRRFGRIHWVLRLVAACAVISLTLAYLTTAGTLDWGVETIGGIMAMLQVGLIVLLAPSLAGGLISSERESGGWELLRMTPLSARSIVCGKLMSVLWTLLLVLLATVPGYLVVIAIKPELWYQVSRVLVCLVLTAVFAMLLSAAMSSIFRRTAVATAVAYTLLVGICGGTLLIWFARNAPFGREVVEAALKLNPLAAALGIIRMADFAQYDLLPANWWITGYLSAACLLILVFQTWRLTRPQ